MKPGETIRAIIKRLENDLASSKEQLAQIEQNCQHIWGPTVDASIHTKGYHFPGDPVGTCGIDRRLPMDIPASTQKRWARTCHGDCGKTEYTTNTTQQVSQTPKFGT